jgi:hypothetical protein
MVTWLSEEVWLIVSVNPFVFPFPRGEIHQVKLRKVGLGLLNQGIVVFLGKIGIPDALSHPSLFHFSVLLDSRNKLH